METAREQNAILVTGDPELRQLTERALIELLWGARGKPTDAGRRRATAGFRIDNDAG